MTRNAARLLSKLERFAPLQDTEKAVLKGAMTNVRQFASHENLVREGKPVEGVFVILEGFACRFKLLADGRRQIVGYLLPGDMCDLRVFMLKRMDHSICALSTVQAALLSPEAVVNMIERFPRLTRALWWTTLVEDSITREWVVNVGQRTASERVAHLFCELFWRLEAVGLARDNHVELPLTQNELADTVALSAVHVNRTLMYLRRVNLAAFQNKQLIVMNRAALEAAAGFNPDYLHLDGADSSTRLPA